MRSQRGDHPPQPARRRRRLRLLRQSQPLLLRGAQFEADLADLDAQINRPRRKDEPGKGPHLAPIRQRVESIYWTAKDILTLERHGARTLHGLRTRLACRFLALAAAIALNHRLGRPSRSLACYTT